LPRFKQTPKAKPVGARIIAGGGNAFHAGIPQRFDQGFGNATEAKTTHSNFHPVKYGTFQCLGSTFIDFFHK
jgi:hypothetical protein